GNISEPEPAVNLALDRQANHLINREHAISARHCLVMREDRIKIAAAIITMAGSLLFLYFSSHESAPKLEMRPHEALGQVLAEEAAKLVGSGGRITLITRDTAS